MKEFQYRLTHPAGIHARPAGTLAALAKGHADTAIRIRLGKQSAEGTDPIQLMRLGAKYGDTVIVTAEGPQEGAVIGEMQKFFKGNL